MVDSDHVGGVADRRSRTGYMIYVQMDLIDWLSKKQATFEKSVFGSGFVAMKHGVETLRRLRYKLCMMGVPIDGPTYIFGDNMSVIFNKSWPESQWKKKSNSIFLPHQLRGGCYGQMRHHPHSDFIKLCRPPNKSYPCTEEAQPCEWYFVWHLLI